MANAVEVAGPELGAVRIDSGDLGVLARQVRDQLDSLGAHRTRIVVSGDLDEFAIAALRAEPVDTYGVGTSVVTGSGAPTAGMVYKLVEVDGIPVEKRSHSQGIPRRPQGGTASGQVDRHRRRGGRASCRPPTARAQGFVERPLMTTLVQQGEPVGSAGLESARERVREGLLSLPWDGLKLSRGEPAIPTRMIAPASH